MLDDALSERSVELDNVATYPSSFRQFIHSKKEKEKTIDTYIVGFDGVG